jgi:hypothetical protein
VRSASRFSRFGTLGVGKLLWADRLAATGDAAALPLGAHLLVDTGVPGTYAWGVHVLGTPGSLFGRDQAPTCVLQLAKAGATKRRRTER